MEGQGPISPAPGSYSPSPARGPSRSGLLIASSVLIAVVVLVGALWVAGVGPFARYGASAGPRTFHGALDESAAAERAKFGGRWSAIYAAGAALGSSYSVSLSGSLSSANLSFLSSLGCSVVLAPGLPSTAAVPARNIGEVSGALDVWVMAFKNASGLISVTVDLDGSVYPILSISGGECSLLAAAVGTIDPSSVLDSPVAFSSAMRAGGSGFLSTHPSSNLSMSLSPTIAFSGVHTASNWTLGLADCALSTNASFATYGGYWSVSLDAATGTVGPTSSNTTGCGPIALGGTGGTIVPPGGLGLVRSILAGFA